MRKAFTLVEILVVLVVIGILIGLILPNTLRAIRQAQIRECASNIRSINSALQLCFSETRDWNRCNNIAALVPNYLEVAPACPFNIGYTVQQTANQWEVNALTHMDFWPNFTNHPFAQ